MSMDGMCAEGSFVEACKSKRRKFFYCPLHFWGLFTEIRLKSVPVISVAYNESSSVVPTASNMIGGTDI